MHICASSKTKADHLRSTRSGTLQASRSEVDNEANQGGPELWEGKASSIAASVPGGKTINYFRRQPGYTTNLEQSEEEFSLDICHNYLSNTASW